MCLTRLSIQTILSRKRINVVNVKCTNNRENAGYVERERAENTYTPKLNATFLAAHSAVCSPSPPTPHSFTRTSESSSRTF